MGQLKEAILELFRQGVQGKSCEEQAARLEEILVQVGGQKGKVKVTIPPGKVVISAQNAVMNPSPIECDVESR